MTDLVYLYAVHSGPPPEARIVGIDERPVRWVIGGNLAAAVGDVPAEEFDEEPLNAAIKDMAWLGSRAVAHQEVNHRLHELSEAIVPLAFGSVFRDDERVRALLRDQAADFAERLGRVRGRSEWVLAVHRTTTPEPRALDDASPAVRELRAEVEAASPGRAHLLRRRLAELEHEELRRIDTEIGSRVLQRLEGYADDVVREPLPQEAIERPVLRASVLVQRTSEVGFVENVEEEQRRLKQLGYQVELTGPWPPYRFAGLSAEERRVGVR